jgi:hypothetical protein
MTSQEDSEKLSEIHPLFWHGNRTLPTLVFSDGSAMTNPSAKEVVEKLASL